MSLGHRMSPCRPVRMSHLRSLDPDKSGGPEVQVVHGSEHRRKAAEDREARKLQETGQVAVARKTLVAQNRYRRIAHAIELAGGLAGTVLYLFLVEARQTELGHVVAVVGAAVHTHVVTRELLAAARATERNLTSRLGSGETVCVRWRNSRVEGLDFYI